jgi:hypothetical protein
MSKNGQVEAASDDELIRLRVETAIGLNPALLESSYVALLTRSGILSDEADSETGFPQKLDEVEGALRTALAIVFGQDRRTN